VASTSSGYFRLKNANNGLCLGVTGADSHKKGAVVDGTSCTPTTADLKKDAEWIWKAGTVTGKYTQQLVNRKSGLCLGVPYNDSQSLGSSLEVWDCAPVTGDARVDENWIAY
jgi:hypothetical protein